MVFKDTSTTDIYTLSLHDALPISVQQREHLQVAHRLQHLQRPQQSAQPERLGLAAPSRVQRERSEEHTSELQSRQYLVCRILLGKNLEGGQHHMEAGGK